MAVFLWKVTCNQFAGIFCQFSDFGVCRSNHPKLVANALEKPFAGKFSFC